MFYFNIDDDDYCDCGAKSKTNSPEKTVENYNDKEGGREEIADDLNEYGEIGNDQKDDDGYEGEIGNDQKDDEDEDEIEDDQKDDDDDEDEDEDEIEDDHNDDETLEQRENFLGMEENKETKIYLLKRNGKTLSYNEDKKKATECMWKMARMEKIKHSNIFNVFLKEGVDESVLILVGSYKFSILSYEKELVKFQIVTKKYI